MDNVNVLLNQHLKSSYFVPMQVRWAESSLRNGFGLKFLHRFFNVPFLTLQRNSLEQQLQQNRLEIRATQVKLNNVRTSQLLHHPGHGWVVASFAYYVVMTLCLFQGALYLIYFYNFLGLTKMLISR